MKRVELIEIGILAVVIILGIRVIETLLNVLIYSLYSFSSNFDRLGNYIWPNVISLAVYFLGFFVLLKNTKWIATYINGKNSEANDTVLRIQKAELLYIIIIAVCIAIILSEAATILIYAFDYFKNVAAGYKSSPPISEGTIRLASFKTAAVKLILTLVLLYFAKPITNSLTKPQSDQPLAETNNKQ